MSRVYDISPIPTIYGQTKFRSRLEATWAKFFTVLEIPYKYECKRFRFDDKSYLPDFCISRTPYRVVEIKPTEPLMEEVALCSGLSHQFGVALFAGSPGLDTLIYPFREGKLVKMGLPKMFGLRYMLKGINPKQMKTLLGFRMVLGRRNYIKALEEIWQ